MTEITPLSSQEPFGFAATERVPSLPCPARSNVSVEYARRIDLGWLFDGFEPTALSWTVGVAMHHLLPAALHPHIPAYAAASCHHAARLGIGGMIGGILADYIGRKRMMIIAVLAYSLTSGLSAFSFNWISFALLRFLVGVAVGSEWATGSSMVAELWPDRARGKGAGLMQCGLGIGFFLASLSGCSSARWDPTPGAICT